MIVTQIRHGSHVIEYKKMRFLVDPVLGDMGTMFALPKGRVNDKNPLLPLPVETSFFSTIDAVILTHLHLDHFDQVAKKIIPRAMPIYCHPAEVKRVKKEGFSHVIGVEDRVELQEMCMLKAVHGGHHGAGISGMLMGRTTGYLLMDRSGTGAEPVVYIIGDSIWCEAVEQCIYKQKPDVMVVFAGEARLPFGKPITMSTNDLEQLALHAPNATIIVNHMDAWNHCFLTREALNDFLTNKEYRDRILIPKDGQCIDLNQIP